MFWLFFSLTIVNAIVFILLFVQIGMHKHLPLSMTGAIFSFCGLIFSAAMMGIEYI